MQYLWLYCFVVVISHLKYGCCSVNYMYQKHLFNKSKNKQMGPNKKKKKFSVQKRLEDCNNVIAILPC